MTQTWDIEKVAEAIKLIRDDIPVDAGEWLANPTNIALVNDRGDVALFEIGLKNIYSGHYAFKSRGKQAIEAAREFLDEIFNTCYNIDVIMGLTPITNLPARWLTRRVGFKSYGVVEGPKRHYEMFIMTKREFNGRSS
jgi:hypothetical protein